MTTCVMHCIPHFAMPAAAAHPTTAPAYAHTPHTHAWDRCCSVIERAINPFNVRLVLRLFSYGPVGIPTYPGIRCYYRTRSRYLLHCCQFITLPLLPQPCCCPGCLLLLVVPSLCPVVPTTHTDALRFFSPPTPRVVTVGYICLVTLRIAASC